MLTAISLVHRCRYILELLLEVLSRLGVHCYLLQVYRAKWKVVIDLIRVELLKILMKLTQLDHLNLFFDHIELRLLIKFFKRYCAIVVKWLLLQFLNCILKSGRVNILLILEIALLLALHLLMICGVWFLVLIAKLVLINNFLLNRSSLIIDQQVLIRVPYLFDFGVSVQVLTKKKGIEIKVNFID